MLTSTARLFNSTFINTLMQAFFRILGILDAEATKAITAIHIQEEDFIKKSTMYVKRNLLEDLVFALDCAGDEAGLTMVLNYATDHSDRNIIPVNRYTIESLARQYISSRDSEVHFVLDHILLVAA